MKICPICNKSYEGYPALSRKDNRTEICSLCEAKEALESCNLPEDKIKELIERTYQT